MKIRKIITGIVAFVMLAMGAPAVNGQAQVIFDYDALINDLSIQSNDLDLNRFVLWMPEQFWDMILSQDPGIGEEDKEEILKVIRPYILIGAMDGQIGALGGTTFTPESTIRESIAIEVDDGKRRFTPLKDQDIEINMLILVHILKPILANSMGPMGENFHFYIFEAYDEEGNLIADPTADGVFTVSLGDEKFHYRLPLGSLLPPKYDPVTGERFPGNYIYSPFTGNLLSSLGEYDL